MARRSTDFQTIRSEGGLLPPDLLRRVLDPKEKLDGTLPEDYGLPEGERLNDVITQSWNRLRKHWHSFRAAAERLPKDEAGTGLTNDKWTLPLLRELGFGLLPTSSAPEIGGRTYAISRFFGPVPTHLIGCGLSLDRRAAGVRGAAAMNPHGLVQEFLNRSPKHLWAIVSNGQLMRVLRDSQALSRQSYLEFDLLAMFDGEVYSDFVLLWLVAHATRFAPREADRADTCWLEQWTKLAEEQGTRALGDLRTGVEKALQVLGEGLTSHPKNTALRDALRTGHMSPSDFHGQLLRVIYRLIFLFVTEDRTIEGRSLLHPPGESESARQARGRYAEYYSTSRLRELASQIKGSRHGDLWLQFQILVGSLSGREDSAAVRDHLALPALGSFLWDPASTPEINDADLTNYDLLEVIRHLAFTRQGKVLRPVDYRNLGAEELGGVYESLLALTPQVSADGARFTFTEFAGSKRKTTGSYYTPDSLVQCLLDSALDPVVEEAIREKTGPDAEKAILDIKICDPAVGSGHFLVGAARRLARHLARVRALAQGESEPSPLLYQQALRDVIGRCVYGVDINPMAAELCRVSLWLEALEPGKPLSFLDHHIRVGNSLLGTAPELIAAGLPDAAFKAIEGDDKKVCSALKKRNKQEREGQLDMVHIMVAEPRIEYSTIEERTQSIDGSPDDTVEDVERKADRFHRLVISPEYKHAQLAADAWCAAFVWKKQANASIEPITTETVRRLEAGSEALTAGQSAEVEKLARQYQFFHWHLAFPEVFARDGFDCIIGNPPWERVKFQEREWFSASRPEIANASTAALRRRLISQLEAEDPALFNSYQSAKRQADGEANFARSSGRFPYGATGDTNTYPLFTEMSVNRICAVGRAGLIVKTGILADFSLRGFFSHLVGSGRLVSAYDFSNRRLIFPAVVANERFTLLTLCGPSVTHENARISILNEDVSDLAAENRIWELSWEDINRVNPNTRTCPLFQTARDASLALRVYHFLRVLTEEALGAEGNPWNVSYVRMFDMTNDSELFRDLESLQSRSIHPPAPKWSTESGEYIGVLEGKLYDLLDHRHGTFAGVPRASRFGIKAEPNHPTSEQLQDPRFVSLPRFWVPSEEVASRYMQRLGFVPGGVLTFRDVCRTHTDLRTVRASICPGWGAGNKAPLLLFAGAGTEEHAKRSALVCTNLASFSLDYIARQKFSGGSLNKFILVQLPVVSPEQFRQACPWVGSGQTLGTWVLPRVIELSYTAWDLEPFAQGCGWSGPPFRWDEGRRSLLRCELDAAFFHLYLLPDAEGNWQVACQEDGCPYDETSEQIDELKRHFPTPREAVDYIMDTFPIVKRKDEERWGEYRTKRVILEMYDAMLEAMRTGTPYQTRLDPPPGPPETDLPGWQPGQPKPVDWPPHIHPPKGCCM